MIDFYKDADDTYAIEGLSNEEMIAFYMIIKTVASQRKPKEGLPEIANDFSALFEQFMFENSQVEFS